MDKQIKKALFNPLSYDLTVDYYDDENNKVVLTVPSMEISHFEGYQGEFMEKHLSERIYHERGNKLNHDDDVAEIKKEINING